MESSGASLSSTTPTTPTAAEPFYNLISGIRAPLTNDESDFEYSSSSRRNSITSSYNSGSELHSDGFASGEDEIETSSERLYVQHDPDEEIIEETHFVNEFSFSKLFVKNPNGDDVQESSNSHENGLSRPYLKNPVRETVQRSYNDFANAISRPYVKEEDYVVKDVNSRSHVGVTSEIVSENKLSVPIAQISGDSDDDTHGSEVMEDDGFSGVARVPSVELFQINNSAPKVRILDFDDDSDDNEPESENTEFVENLVVSNGVSGPKVRILDYDNDSEDNEPESENTGFVENLLDSNGVSGPKVRILDFDDNSEDNEPESENTEFVENLVVSNGVSGPKVRILDYDDDSKDESEVENTEFFDDLVVSNGSSVCKDEEERIGVCVSQDEGPDVNKELQATATSMVSNEEYTFMSDWNKNPKCIGMVDYGTKCLDLVNHREPIDGDDDMMLHEQNSCVEQMVSEITEPESSCISREVSMDDQNSEIMNASEDDNLVFNEDFKSDLVENIAEQMIDQIVESFSSVSFSKTELSPEFSEVLEKTEQGNMCNMLDNGCQSVLVGADLEEEINDEAQNMKFLIAEKENEESHTFFTGVDNLQDRLEEINGQIVKDSEKEISKDDEVSVTDRQAIYSSALVDISTAIDGIQIFNLEKESSDMDSIPVHDAKNPRLCASSISNGELEDALSEGEKKKLEKILQIRGKYLSFLRKLGRSSEDSVAAKVLHQLMISSSSQALDSTKKAAMELEMQRDNDSDISLSILVIGKTGVGKSATINSIFGDKRMEINAFEPKMAYLKETIGMINGVKVKVIDTPGLRTSLTDQSINRKVFLSIKKLVKKSPPDIFLYVDRLDTLTSDFNDLPLLKLVKAYLGSSIWLKSVLVLTHASSVPPDGPNGYPMSYELFVAQRARVLQQMISHSACGFFNPGSLIPISLVENQQNEHGESWKSQLLLLCYSMKVLSEVKTVVENRNIHSNLFGFEICTKKSNDVSVDLNVEFMKLLQMNQWTEEIRRFLSLRKPENNSSRETLKKDQETGNPEIVAVSLPEMGLSFVKRGDIIWGCNLQYQFSVCKSLKVNFRGGLNEKQSCHISVKTSSCVQLQIAALAMLQIAKAIFKNTKDYSK